MSQQPDSIVCAVIEMFKSRAAFGKKKYGTDLDRQDLATLDWIQHAQEELMDGILYLQKLKTQFTGRKDHTAQTTSPLPSPTEILQKSLEGNGC
jgi:hypothetical protein